MKYENFDKAKKLVNEIDSLQEKISYFDKGQNSLLLSHASWTICDIYFDEEAKENDGIRRLADQFRLDIKAYMEAKLNCMLSDLDKL